MISGSVWLFFLPLLSSHPPFLLPSLPPSPPSYLPSFLPSFLFFIPSSYGKSFRGPLASIGFLSSQPLCGCPAPPGTSPVLRNYCSQLSVVEGQITPKLPGWKQQSLFTHSPWVGNLAWVPLGQLLSILHDASWAHSCICASATGMAETFLHALFYSPGDQPKLFYVVVKTPSSREKASLSAQALFSPLLIAPLLMCHWPKQVTCLSSPLLWEGPAQMHGHWEEWISGGQSWPVYTTHICLRNCFIFRYSQLSQKVKICFPKWKSKDMTPIEWWAGEFSGFWMFDL